MKTNHEISKLSEFESELEALNNSEMKGIVGGTTIVACYGPPSSYYSSAYYSSSYYYSQYYSTSPSLPPVPSYGGGSGSSAPSPEEEEDGLPDILFTDVIMKSDNTNTSESTSSAYMVSRANANYSSAMGN